MDITVYAIRHGQCDANVADVYAGWTDSPLTQRGIEEARRAAATLPPGIIRIYAADHARTLATGYEIAHVILTRDERAPIQIAVREFREICVGEMEGGPVIHGEHPSRRGFYEGTWAFPGRNAQGHPGESLADVDARFFAGLTRILGQGSDGDRIAIVSSNGTLRRLLARFLHWDVERVLGTHLPNAMVFRMRFRVAPDGTWECVECEEPELATERA